MSNGHLLFESIFERKLSADDTRDHLEQITLDYPYFSPAQFYLLFKTAPDMPGYQQLAARTNVLFNNAYWLQFQLREEQGASEQEQEVIDDPVEQIEPTPVTTAAPVDVSQHPGTDLDMVSEEIPAPVSSEEKISAVQDLPTVASEGSPGLTTTGNEPLQPVRVETDPVPKSVDNEEILENIPTQIVEPSHPAESFPSPAGAEELPVENEEVSAEEGHDDTTTSVEDENQTADAPHSLHFNNQSTPLVNEIEKEDEISAEQEIAPLHFKLNLETPATTEDTLTFEPLHTSDYFASLGIKLSGDVKPNDKLGKQLKSFTEWLKTMKKVHNDQLPPLSGKADQSIQKLAEQSNKDDAVLTEAMADVLLKQGKAEKAIEVYKKLSLLNPSKSTYFAAKIDQLKEH